MRTPDDPATGDPAGATSIIRRVGPNHAMAADSQLGVALTTLWHAVSEVGGSVGFAPSAQRYEVAAAAAATIDAMRRGRAVGVALISGRALIGFGLLTPGERMTRHTGVVTLVMVDPDRQGTGAGTTVMHEILALAKDLGLERLTLSVRDGTGLEEYYARWGFVEWGRTPGWIRVADGDDREEIHLLAPTTAAAPTR